MTLSVSAKPSQPESSESHGKPASSTDSVGPLWKPSRLWRWVFRLTAALVVPVLMLLFVEGVLRLSGSGDSMSFTRGVLVNGVDCREPNPAFGWRYFPKEIARKASWFAYPEEKTPETIRIFVLGGSAAQGDPEPTYGVTRMLDKMLRHRYPDKQFEVINAAMTAINSHVVRDIASEVVKHDPDLLVVYMGNNEVVGPFGAANPLVPMADSMVAIRASLFAKGTRLGQMMLSALVALTPEEAGNQRWRGMEMFLEGALAADAPELETVYSHFQANLNAILNSATDEGVPVLLSTVAVNLRDCAPFASAHSPDSTEDDLSEWIRIYEEGCSLQMEGQLDSAIESFRAAVAIDGQHAELHYRLGQCLLQLQQWEKAGEYFVRARDLDALRFRADSRINEMIRATATAADGVTLVDAEQALAQQSPQGLPGSELFFEHVHFNFHGNYVLARELLDAAEKQLAAELGEPNQSVPTEAACRELLAYTDYDRLTVLQMILGRLEVAPFTGQLDREKQYLAYKHEAEELDQMLRREGFAKGQQRYVRALKAAPDDPWLHYRFGFFQLKGSGGFAGAVSSFKEAQRLGLETPELLLGMGMARYHKGKMKAAIADFRKGLELDPGHWRLLSQLGFVLNLMGEKQEGMELCARAVELAPDRPGAQTNLGLVLMESGNFSRAQECFEKAIELGGETASILANLGIVLRAQEKEAEAVARFEQALELAPGHFKANRELGDIHLERKELTSALQHFRSAHAARPNDIGCANNLAWLLATIPEATLRDGEMAVDVASSVVLETGGQNSSALDTLAAAYAEAGRFELAVSTAQHALKLASDDADLSKQIQERLEQYLQREPHREHSVD